MKSNQVKVIHLAPSLVNAGYQVIPVDGEARPLVKYKNKVVSLAEAKIWSDGYNYADANIALCTGRNNVYALDFDVDDNRLASQLLRIIKKKWKNIPVRKCNNPRFAILFKAGDDLINISNGYSSGYKLKGKGDINQIELIGYNKTITIYGQHRHTGNNYHWATESHRLKTKADDLPIINLEDINRIFKFFESHQSEYWQKVHSGSMSLRVKKRIGDDFENARLIKKYSEEQIEKILNEASCESRDEWVKTGMALKIHYAGSLLEGLQKWDEWSQTKEGYVSYEDCAEQWRSFDNDKPNAVTMQTIEKTIIRKKNLVNPSSKELTLEEVLDDYVWITKGQRVGKLTGPSNQCVVQSVDLKAAWMNRFIKVPKVNKKTGETTQEWVCLFDVWRRSNPSIRHEAVSTTYVPGKDRMVYPNASDKEGTGVYFNEYHEPNVMLTENTDLIHYFVNHMQYIFNDNFDLAVNWFAQIVQQPWKRYRTALYSICFSQSTGRGWLNDVISEVVCRENVSTPKIEDIMGDGKFTEHIDDKVLAIISEISARGTDRYRLSDSLKSFLSDDYQQTNKKYGEKHASKKIYTRLFAQSNDLTDLYIEEKDTRMIVCINREEPKDNSYYIKLNDLLETDNRDFFNQVYTYLMNWKVNIEYLIGAPRTKDKIEVIEAVKSPTALALYKLKLTVNKHFISDHMLNNFISHFIIYSTNAEDGMHTPVNEKELRRLCKEQIQTTDVVDIGGKSIKLSSFHRHNLNETPKQKIVSSFNKSKRLISQTISKLESTKEK